jgi:thiol-disulfide isomerase/thioredoxin
MYLNKAVVEVSLNEVSKVAQSFFRRNENEATRLGFTKLYSCVTKTIRGPNFAELYCHPDGEFFLTVFYVKTTWSERMLFLFSPSFFHFQAKEVSLETPWQSGGRFATTSNGLVRLDRHSDDCTVVCKGASIDELLKAHRDKLEEFKKKQKNPVLLTSREDMLHYLEKDFSDIDDDLTIHASVASQMMRTFLIIIIKVLLISAVSLGIPIYFFGLYAVLLFVGGGIVSVVALVGGLITMIYRRSKPLFECPHPAPDYSFTSLDTSSKPITHSSQMLVTVFDFWSSRCAPCEQALPHIAEIREKYRHDPRVRVFAVNIDLNSPNEELTEWLDQRRIDTAMILRVRKQDAIHDILKSFGARGVPHIIGIDQNQAISFMRSGFSDDTAPWLCEQIDGLLNEQEKRH